MGEGELRESGNGRVSSLMGLSVVFGVIPRLDSDGVMHRIAG